MIQFCLPRLEDTLASLAPFMVAGVSAVGEDCRLGGEPSVTDLTIVLPVAIKHDVATEYLRHGT